MMPSSASPSAIPRGYGAPPDSAAFDYDRQMGYKTPVRVGSADDPFRAPGGPAPAPIGQRVPSQPASLYGESEDPFGMSRLDSPGDHIAPIGSRPTFDQAPGGASGHRLPSPSQPGKILGSAALGAADDEIVTPAARRNVPPPGPAPGWKMPQAPGAGRWSAAPPSIWGLDNSSSWRGAFGAPGGMGSPTSAPGSAVSAPSSALSGGPPQDFGLPVAPGVPPIGGEHRRAPGFGLPGGSAGAGSSGQFSAYPPNLFGPPHQ
jgi:hypothetical protein